MSALRIDKILVPTDCSPPSVAAITAAVELAAGVGGKVDVLHVVPRPVDYYPLDNWIWGEEENEHRLDERMRRAAKEGFDAFLAKLPDDVRKAIDTRMELGVSYEVILRVAEDDAYGLIVMSTRGHTGMKRIMLGSVAERVVRLASCPVLTIRS